jgi:hypothetical protein
LDFQILVTAHHPINRYTAPWGAFWGIMLDFAPKPHYTYVTSFLTPSGVLTDAKLTSDRSPIMATLEVDPWVTYTQGVTADFKVSDDSGIRLMGTLYAYPTGADWTAEAGSETEAFGEKRVASSLDTAQNTAVQIVKDYADKQLGLSL